MIAARCILTDLYPAQCAHCRHIPDLFPPVVARIVERRETR